MIVTTSSPIGQWTDATAASLGSGVVGTGVNVCTAVGVGAASADGDGTGVGVGLAADALALGSGALTLGAEALALGEGVASALADGATAAPSGSRMPFTKLPNATPATRAVTATAPAEAARSGELVIQDHAARSRFNGRTCSGGNRRPLYGPATTDGLRWVPCCS